jgi:type IV secretion system protein VirD4
VLAGALGSFILATRSRAHRAGAMFSSLRQCRGLLVKGDPPHRILLGTYATPLWRGTSASLYAPNRDSVLVLGPTQSGKTSSLVVPAIRSWHGPVVAASVKEDLVVATLEHRTRRGPSLIFNPLGGPAQSASFDPISHCSDWETARRIARVILTPAAHGIATAESEFWAQLSAKLLAPLFLAAHVSDGTLRQASKWVNFRSVEEPLRLLERAQQEAAWESLAAAVDREERQLSSVYATIEAALEPFHLSMNSQGQPIDTQSILTKDGSLFLCAPAHDQSTYHTVFSTVISEVLVTAFELARAEGGTLKHPLLLVLDEAANIAPLPDLDVVASICASHGVTLLTCFQDLAQIRSRYGEKWATVVNNHRTRILLSGMADPNIDDLVRSYFGELSGTSKASLGSRQLASQRNGRLIEPFQLRELPKFRGVVVSGRMPPIRLALKANRESSNH